MGYARVGSVQLEGLAVQVHEIKWEIRSRCQPEGDTGDTADCQFAQHEKGYVRVCNHNKHAHTFS